jgi:hypothetical protein
MKKTGVFIISGIAVVLVLCCFWILQPVKRRKAGDTTTLEQPKLPENLPLTASSRQGGITITRLQSFFPPRDIEIMGIPCRATPFCPVSLYENGDLKECTLSRDFAIGGNSLDEGQTVVLDDHGGVRAVSNPSAIERARSWFHKILR